MPPSPSPTRWASRSALTVVIVVVLVAGLVLGAGDSVPGYHRVDGPLLVELGPGRGIHLADVVVLAVCVVIGIGAIRGDRAGVRPDDRHRS